MTIIHMVKMPPSRSPLCPGVSGGGISTLLLIWLEWHSQCRSAWSGEEVKPRDCPENKLHHADITCHQRI